MNEKPKPKTREKKFRKQQEMRNLVVSLMFSRLEYRRKEEKWDDVRFGAEKGKIYKMLFPLLQGQSLCEDDQIPDTLNALCGSAISYKSEKSDYGYVPAEYLIWFVARINGADEFVEMEPDIDYLKRTGLFESLNQIIQAGTLEIKIDMKNHSSDRIKWELEEILRAIKSVKKACSESDDPPKIMDAEKILLWFDAWVLSKSNRKRRDKLSDMDIAKKLFPNEKSQRILESVRVNVARWCDEVQKILDFLDNTQLEKKSPFFLLRKEEPEYFI
jgi:hypothetical protein